MTSHQAAAGGPPPVKTVFALSSWGNAGVPWVMACLNLHPEVRAWSCMHLAPYSPLGRELSPVEYLDALARVGWGQHSACGDVHGVGWDQFAGLHGAFGPAFRRAHLVGHPVNRLAGSLYFSQELGRVWKHQDFLDLWGMSRDDPRAVQARDILGEDGDHIPAHYMINVNSIAAIAGPGGALADPLYRLEALMQSDDAWDGLVRHLSGDSVRDYGDRWRQYEGVVMGTAHQPFAHSPRQVWDDLPEYARRIVAAALTEPSRQAFEALGYDLSFVR